MNYEAFRRIFDAALGGADLLSTHDHAEESVDLASMSRAYSIRLGMFRGQPAEPFWGSMEIRWTWHALTSARSRTTEEDVLTELLGRENVGRVKTDPPWLRVDVRFDGKLAWDRPVLLPKQEVWRDWVGEVMAKLEPLLPDADGVPITCCRGEPEAQVGCGRQGELLLLGVELAAWQAITIPRQWSNSERKPDVDPEVQLRKFSKRLHGALEVWKRCLKSLLPATTTLN